VITEENNSFPSSTSLRARIMPSTPSNTAEGLIAGTALTRIEVGLLAVFLGSTPLTLLAQALLGGERAWWALANSYSFSAAYCLLYAWPLVRPWPGATWATRLHAATSNWIVWLTCFTQILFQIPHTILPSTLSLRRGSALEWPFYAYGLSDARWTAYESDATTGLPPEVWLININDASLGVLVLIAYVRARRAAAAAAAAAAAPRSSVGATAELRASAARAHVALALATLFRDATLLRETVEYMGLQHHKASYPHTTGHPSYRAHAIACLWLVNGPWLVAPLGTAWWAWNQIWGAHEMAAGKRAA
jgi:hypothetical protein